MVECTLLTMCNENGAVIPPNLVHGRFLHITADNIDINDPHLVERILLIVLRLQLGSIYQTSPLIKNILQLLNLEH